MAIEDGEKGVNLEVKSSRGRRIEKSDFNSNSSVARGNFLSYS